MLCSFRCLLCPHGANIELTLNNSQMVTGGEVVMRNFKECGVFLVHSFGKVSKSRRWLSPTTPASILANNTFWLWVLQDLVKIKIPPHWYAIVYLPSMSTVQHGKMPLDESWLCSPVSTLPSCFHSHPPCTFSWFALHNVLLHRPVPPSASQQGHLPQCCQGMDGRHGITVGYCL